MSRFCGSDLVGRWRDRFDQFLDAALTVAEFCRQEGVSTSNFYHWKKKLAIPSTGRRKAKTTPKTEAKTKVEATPKVEAKAKTEAADVARFVSVVVQSASVGARLLLPGGAVIELPSELEPSRLIELIAAVVQATDGSDRNAVFNLPNALR